MVHSQAPIIAAALLAALLAGCSSGGGIVPECGNGTLEGAEACDDGNLIACDGCSADCEVETGLVCGDGILNTVCGEQCDDGNTVPGDGCDANCQSETCGDGTQLPPEECDDGNLIACDGCSADCEIETGFVCGDGELNAACGEECDDGGTAACDGCTEYCEIETGHICGDGILRPLCGEQCDDGNTVPGDGCDASCQLETAPLPVTGEYDLTIGVALDSCGFVGTGPATSPMDVFEAAQDSVVLNLPVGGAGGECNRESYARDGNTVTRVESSEQEIGPCVVRTVVVSTLTFFADDSVTGLETNALSAESGDCSGLNLPCRVELTVSGARCSGCFDCVQPPAAAADRLLGPIGSATGPRPTR